jgi:hypothetical protein
MPKKFTDFQEITQITGDDYLIGINSQQNSEFRTKIISLTSQPLDLSSKSNLIYNIVQTNSSTNWNNDIVTKYADSKFIPTSGGHITGNLFVTSSVNISGNIIIQNDLIVGASQDTTLYVENKKIGINTEIPNHTLTVVGSISSTGNVIFSNLPTLSSGLPKGSIYVESGVLKIVL